MYLKLNAHTGRLVDDNTAFPSPLTVARGPCGLHTLITQLTWSKTAGQTVQYLITASQTQARMTFAPLVSFSEQPPEPFRSLIALTVGGKNEKSLCLILNKY